MALTLCQDDLLRAFIPFSQELWEAAAPVAVYKGVN